MEQRESQGGIKSGGGRQQLSRRGAALLALGVVSSGAAAAAPVVQNPAYRQMAPCQIEKVQGEALCGTLLVREDRRRRGGRRIPLNVVILKATAAERAADPLFTFAGGPGQSEAADAADNAVRFASIRRERDIVMVDQRGTGQSNPLDCPLGGGNESIRALLGGQLPLGLIEACRADLERRADLRLYTTAHAADDVEEVRRRLGYGRINLYGGSYGSRAALVYLQRYPRQVRTATLRAVFPLALRNPLHSPRDAQAALDRLFADCAADQACNGRYPDIARQLQTLLAQLEREPVTLAVDSAAGSVQAEVNRPVFAGIVRRMMYHPRHQAAVPAMIASAARGDFTALQPALAQALGMGQALSLGMFLSVTCAEDVALINEQEIDRATGSSFLGASATRSLVAACRLWPEGRLPARYHQPVHSPAPVLLISGALDPMTPARYGAEVARTLPNSRHVVLEGVAHNPFPDCALAMMQRLVDTGSTAGITDGCRGNLGRSAFAGAPR